MKKWLLSLALLLGGIGAANAQVPCIGVGGVNTVPQVGVACQQEAAVPTYTATSRGIVPASTATDIFCLSGVANKVLRVQRVRLSGTAGTLINLPVFLTKHSSADSGGTAYSGAGTTQVPVASAMDSNNPASSAVLTAYSANPTINDSSPIYVTGAILPLQLSGTTLGTNGLLFDFGDFVTAQKVNLRSAAEQLCVNLSGASVSSGVVNISVLWTESAQ